MGVFIPCPECGGRVHVVEGGFVVAHKRADGEPCGFTRTAHSGGPATFVEPSDEKRRQLERRRAHYEAMVAKEKRRAVEREERRAVEDASRAETGVRMLSKRERKAEQAARRRATASGVPRVECPRCGVRVKPSDKSPTGLAAHIRPSGHWCRGGGEPTEAQRKKAVKGKRSVWTTSGGLPTLGRR